MTLFGVSATLTLLNKLGETNILSDTDQFDGLLLKWRNYQKIGNTFLKDKNE